jgi:ABC-type polysaccharide/polyol phosphate export permease
LIGTPGGPNTAPVPPAPARWSLDAISEGLGDFTAAWRRRHLALHFAWTETLARYRRSALGPLWLVLGTLIGVVGLGYVWSILLDIDRDDYIPSLTVGLVTWQFISGSIMEGTGLFARNASSVTNVKLPSFLISMQLMARQLINLTHNALVVLGVLVVYPQHLSPVALLALPGLALVALNLMAVIQIVGYVGARFRDTEPLIAAFMPILFFLSPVIYDSAQLGKAEAVMAFNPIAYYIRIIREPVMGVIPSLTNYLSVGGLTLVVVLVALWLTGTRAHRLPYWV